MFTDSLRKQHEETLSLINEISSYLTESSLAEYSQQVRLLLSTLLGKANYHRGVEDTTLYPKLLQHESSEMRSLAERYYKGFIDTKDVLANYSAKWASPAKIKDNPNEFIDETRAIFNKMSDRIDKENRELFALADKLI